MLGGLDVYKMDLWASFALPFLIVKFIPCLQYIVLIELHWTTIEALDNWPNKNWRKLRISFSNLRT